MNLRTRVHYFRPGYVLEVLRPFPCSPVLLADPCRPAGACIDFSLGGAGGWAGPGPSRTWATRSPHLS